MDAIKQWTIPIVLLVAWLAAASYTVASLSWASEAWQMRVAAEVAQPAPATAAEVAQAVPAAESESTQSPARLGQRLLTRPARSAATSLP